MIPSRLLLILRATLVIAAMAVASSATAQETAERQEAALVHAQCMRDNGYAEFPDPEPNGDFRIRVTPETAPRFEAAAKACQHLAPEGLRGEDIAPEALEALLQFAQCVRDNGLPNFPDPDAKGRFDPRGVGVGPDDPRLQTAMQACRNEVGGGRGMRITIGG
ncbi:MAG TPA: hypothetical protein VIN06_17850 [Devosia sp.]